jgi:hypothetical protein
VSDCCDSCDCCPWEEPLDAHDRRVDRIACKTIGHKVQRYETGGRRCLRCRETLSESKEEVERAREYERKTRGMGYWDLMAYNHRLAFQRPGRNVLITDLTDPMLVGS